MIFRGKLINVIADSSNKQFIVAIIIISVLSLIILNMLSNYFIPQVFIDVLGLENCPENYETFRGLCHNLNLSKSNKWVAYLGNLGRENQVLWITGEVSQNQNYYSQDLKENIDLNFSVIVSQLTKYEIIEDQGKEIEAQKHKLKIKCSQSSPLCQSNNFLIIYPQDKSEITKIEIDIYLPYLTQNQIQSINFNAKTIDVNYTKFLFFLRGACLLISLIFGSIYFLFFIEIPTNLRTFEHYYIGILLMALIFFNNPMYGFIITKNSTFFVLFGDVLMILYLSLLILFWIIMLQRIHKETILLRTNLVNKKNFIIFIIVFSLMLPYVLFMNYFTKYYPGFHISTEHPIFFKTYQTFCLLILIFFFGIFVWSVVKVFQNWNKLIPRHKFFFIFSFYFIVIFTSLAITFFNEFSNQKGFNILLFFVLNNFYVIMLSILWRFSSKGNLELDEYNQEVQKLRNQSEKSFIGKSYFEDNFDIKIVRKGDQHNTTKKTRKESGSRDLIIGKKNTVLSISSFNISDNSSAIKTDNSSFLNSEQKSEVFSEKQPQLKNNQNQNKFQSEDQHDLQEDGSDMNGISENLYISDALPKPQENQINDLHEKHQEETDKLLQFNLIIQCLEEE